MAQITGTIGNDTLYGTAGADRIEGLAGNDWIWSRAGDDHLLGGDGDDVLEAEGGADLLEGEGGNDRINVGQNTHAGQLVVVRGGSGNDQISFSLFGEGGGTIEADGGDGDDVLWVSGLVSSTARLTLGEGRDSIRLHEWYQGLGQSSVEVADFQPGASGDRIDWDLYLNRILSGWNRDVNPFASGHLRATQQGADVLLEIDTDGAAAGAGFLSFITFRNTGLAALTAENFGGYPADGGPIVGLTLSGGEGKDEIRGTAGGDLIEGLGGDDQILGGAGDDTLRGGDGRDDLRGEGGSNLIEGGDGPDSLWDGDGNDRLYGGEGDDFMFAGQSDQAFGEGGNDTIRYGHSSSMLSVPALVSGGAGDDAIDISVSDGGSVAVEVDAGAGSDIVSLNYVYYSVASITLGEGSDVLRLSGSASIYSGTVHIEDFVGGPAGDRVDWIGLLGSRLSRWDGAANPFSTGHVRLVQSGADTVLEVDEDGPDPWGFSSYSRLLTFRNLDAGQLTAANFDGFAPDGSATVGVVLTGTGLSERLEGGNGPDVIDGAGGNDTIVGGVGHDTLRGGDADDDLSGGLGNDLLEGGGGNDILVDGSGSDLLYGGEGNDRLTTGAGTTDSLHGEGGNDTLIVYHSDGGRPSTTSDNQVSVSGGAGDDTFFLKSDNRSFITADAGVGNDVVTLQRSFLATFTITLGEGRDTVRIQTFYAHENVRDAIVTDFTAGPNGDTLDWDQFVASSVIGWNGTTNPFTAGYLRLLQVGADTLVQLDADGTATRFGFKTVLTLKNVDARFFEAGNFDGYDPHSRVVVAGTDGADTLNGTAGRDSVEGGGGNDLLLLQAGGDDTAYGGDGNDVFYFGSAFTGDDRADGGAGRDAIVLQGNFTAVLSEANFTDIESMSLQSGAATRWGDTANNSYDYDLTTADGNVAAGQQLIVNAQSLRTGEDFTFDGSAESDGRFLVYGGHGVDDLTGGDGADVFFFEGVRWGADDEVNGGDGRDALVISGGSGTTHIEFAADALTSIESISLNNRFATDPTQKPSYELVLHNGNVAAGGTLIVNGSSIPGGQQVIIDGRGVHGGNLTLFAGGGHDVLTGGDGADLIVGGAGADSLTGGGGADTFRYDAASDSVGLADLIGDFQSGLDRIDLSRIDADTIAGGNQAFSWIGSNAFSGSAG
ncbi:MAG TPA: calcium-binding protein, partial [Allosphingosinicella sp.]